MVGAVSTEFLNEWGGRASMLLCGSRAYPRVTLLLVTNGWIPLALVESILSPPAGGNMKQHCPIVSYIMFFHLMYCPKSGAQEHSPGPPVTTEMLVRKSELFVGSRGNSNS